MKETLKVNDLTYYRGYGFYEEEHRLLTQFSVDVTVERIQKEPIINPKLTDLINYELIKSMADEVFEHQWSFIEEITQAIFTAVAEKFEDCKVSVSLTKHQPPLLNCKSTFHQVSNL